MTKKIVAENVDLSQDVSTVTCTKPSELNKPKKMKKKKSKGNLLENDIKEIISEIEEDSDNCNISLDSSTNIADEVLESDEPNALSPVKEGKKRKHDSIVETDKHDDNTPKKLKKKKKKSLNQQDVDDIKKENTSEDGISEESKNQAPLDSSLEALKYVREFCKSKETWKFQKHRQIKILKIMYDTKKVPDEDFEYVLDYLHAMKGQARTRTIQEAEQLIEQHDNQNNDDDDEEDEDGDGNSILKKDVTKVKDVITEAHYERVRKIVQLLV